MARMATAILHLSAEPELAHHDDGGDQQEGGDRLDRKTTLEAHLVGDVALDGELEGAQVGIPTFPVFSVKVTAHRSGP